MKYRWVIIISITILVLVLVQTPQESEVIVSEETAPEESEAASKTENIEPSAIVNINPSLNLDGSGSNIDSVDFWYDNDKELYLFVTSKNSNLVQVWKEPFEEELTTLNFPGSANGVTVDQEKDILYIGLKSSASVHELTLPNFERGRIFAQQSPGGETNMDILYHTNGETWIYVTENNNVFVYDTETLELLHEFSPPVSSMETVLADSYHQIIYVPEEQGPSGNPGVYAYHPDGKPYLKEGTNVFGDNNIFQADEEGIALYRCFENEKDTGEGFIIVADQKGRTTDFEFFDRNTWKHLITLNLDGVGNTDGIAVIEQSFEGYPQGLFAAVDNDASTAIIGIKKIFEKTGLEC